VGRSSSLDVLDAGYLGYLPDTQVVEGSNPSRPTTLRLVGSAVVYCALVLLPAIISVAARPLLLLRTVAFRRVVALILTSHVMFGTIICISLPVIVRLCGIRSPPRLFYLFTFFMMESPDLDHLYFLRMKIENLIPSNIWELFKWGLRTQYNPLTFLHFWIYPFALLASMTFRTRVKPYKWFVLGAFSGWTVHLILDGVMYFV
jgi:hypothetical protein